MTHRGQGGALLKPFMLIKSNDFLRIQLAGEEPLDAKLIPTDRGSVCETAQSQQHTDETEQSLAAPQIRCCGSSWLKQLTALRSIEVMKFDLLPLGTVTHLSASQFDASQLTFHDLPHPQDAHISDQSFPKEFS